MSHVVIPYVEGVSERIYRVIGKSGVATAMRPHTTLRFLLVHPKDNVELAEQGELVYQIPYKTCGVEYIGETGRLLKTQLDEHRKDGDNTNNEKYTRNEKKRQMCNFNKSALTDHATTENHITDWKGETRTITSYSTCTMTSFVTNTEDVHVQRQKKASTGKRKILILDMKN